jgi:hypothetical protein
LPILYAKSWHITPQGINITELVWLNDAGEEIRTADITSSAEHIHKFPIVLSNINIRKYFITDINSMKTEAAKMPENMANAAKLVFKLLNPPKK